MLGYMKKAECELMRYKKQQEPTTDRMDVLEFPLRMDGRTREPGRPRDPPKTKMRFTS